MQFLKALHAFYYNLFERECQHKQVTATPGTQNRSGYCPDCGYKIVLLWTLCRCRTCGSKRLPKTTPDGRVTTLYKYCQHCGQADYQIIKRDKINAHEMQYAILSKEIDYAEERLTQRKRPDNPFEIYDKLNIVEGEVIRKSESAVYGQAKL